MFGSAAPALAGTAVTSRIRHSRHFRHPLTGRGRRIRERTGGRLGPVQDAPRATWPARRPRRPTGGLVRACEAVAGASGGGPAPETMVVPCQGPVLLCAPCRRRVRASGGWSPGGRGSGRRRRPRAGDPPPRAPRRAYLCILSWWLWGGENRGEGSRYAYGGTGPGGWGDPPPWAVRLPSRARGASCRRVGWLAPVPPRAGGGRGLVRCRPATWSPGLSSRACGCLSRTSASSCPIGPWSASAPCGCLSRSEGERLAVSLSSRLRGLAASGERARVVLACVRVRDRTRERSWPGAGVLGAVTVRAGTAAWEPRRQDVGHGCVSPPVPGEGPSCPGRRRRRGCGGVLGGGGPLPPSQNGPLPLCRGPLPRRDARGVRRRPPPSQTGPSPGKRVPPGGGDRVPPGGDRESLLGTPSRDRREGVARPSRGCRETVARDGARSVSLPRTAPAHAHEGPTHCRGVAVRCPVSSPRRRWVPNGRSGPLPPRSRPHRIRHSRHFRHPLTGRGRRIRGRTGSRPANRHEGRPGRSCPRAHGQQRSEPAPRPSRRRVRERGGGGLVHVFDSRRWVVVAGYRGSPRRVLRPLAPYAGPVLSCRAGRGVRIVGRVGGGRVGAGSGLPLPGWSRARARVRARRFAGGRGGGLLRGVWRALSPRARGTGRGGGASSPGTARL